MKRYDTLFNSLKEKSEGGFIPFVLLGDPNPEVSERIIETLIESGADALELGVPFSPTRSPTGPPSRPLT